MASNAAAGANIGAGLGGDLGSLIGDLFAGGNRDRIKEILAQLNAEAGPSAMSGFKADPTLRTDEMGSLEALRRVASSGGMRTEDKVGLQQAIDASNTAERGNRGAILQHMASRGMGGSGLELAAQLDNEQGSANRTAATAATAAGDASRRALQAIQMQGQTASGIRGQDFQEAAGKAGAQDAMSRFNAGQRVTKAGMDTGVEQEEIDRKRKLGAGIGSDVGAIGGFAAGKYL